jgi:hypothetical protein
MGLFIKMKAKMAKIVLGKRPAEFKRTVSFPMLDGSTGSIEIRYRYRTRKEFGLFIDELMAAAGETKTPDDEKFSMADLMEKTAGNNATYVLQVANGWNLDEELTHDTVQQLSDELPAAVNAIMETYRLAVTEGRLGN